MNTPADITKFFLNIKSDRKGVYILRVPSKAGRVVYYEIQRFGIFEKKSPLNRAGRVASFNLPLSSLPSLYNIHRRRGLVHIIGLS